jgi:hypothetical protein
MKKFSFYIATAFLAFGFGVCVVYFGIYKNEKTRNGVPFPTKPAYSDFKSEIRNSPPIEAEPIPNKATGKTSCKNKLYLKIYEAFLNAKESGEEFSDYIETTNCEENFRVEKNVDLNNDGKKEIIIRGIEGSWMCGGTGNCGEWIFEKIGKDYRQLLNASALSLNVKKEKTRNYNDIFTKYHMSAGETYETTYKFNGNKYVESNCNYVTYSSEDKKSVMTCKEKDKEFQKP